MVFCTLLHINVAVDRVSFPETVVRARSYTSTSREEYKSTPVSDVHARKGKCASACRCYSAGLAVGSGKLSAEAGLSVSLSNVA